MILLSQKPGQHLPALCGLASKKEPSLLVPAFFSLHLEIKANGIFRNKVLPCSSGKQPRAVLFYKPQTPP